MANGYIFDRAGAKAVGWTDQDIDQFLASLPAKEGSQTPNPQSYLGTDLESLVRSQVPTLPTSGSQPPTPSNPASGFFSLSDAPIQPTSSDPNLFKSSSGAIDGIPSVPANPNVPEFMRPKNTAPTGLGGIDMNLLLGDPNRLRIGGR